MYSKQCKDPDMKRSPETANREKGSGGIIDTAARSSSRPESDSLLPDIWCVRMISEGKGVYGTSERGEGAGSSEAVW